MNIISTVVRRNYCQLCDNTWHTSPEDEPPEHCKACNNGNTKDYYKKDKTWGSKNGQSCIARPQEES